jgi:plastocyanin
VDHNTISNTGPWTSGIVNPNGNFQRTFPDRGTFDYFCSLHANMNGTIIVE